MIATNLTNIISRPRNVFIIIWVLVFALYFITGNAGWVTDTVDWQYRIERISLWDYLNLVQTHVPSLYHSTQLVTYLLYKLYGFNPWAWHITHVSLHALHATLWFIFLARLLNAAKAKNAVWLSFFPVLLYSIVPHISEVIVWKASFHYLLAGVLMMLDVGCLLKSTETGKKVYALPAAASFLVSAFSLEVFYLTPWLLLATAVYYFSLSKNTKRLKISIIYFFLPQLVLFLAHLVLLKISTGSTVAHIGDKVLLPATEYLRKAPEYVFHLVFLGRFFPQDLRQNIYSIIETPAFLTTFYFLLAALLFVSILRFRAITANGKYKIILLIILVMHFVLVSPVWFPQLQLVAYDRYSYLLLPALYALLISLFRPVMHTRLMAAIFFVYLAANVYFTLKVNRLWQKSTKVVNSLTSNFPAPGNKTVLLLNLPENFNGVPMIGALPESFFKLRHAVHNGKELPNQVYDVASFNITSPKDGAHVRVLNDTMLQVTLNQWGTWWWYQFRGAGSYNNEDFKLDMKDVGHWYELTLHRPYRNYHILFSAGGIWKVVDMSKKEVDQY